MEVAKTLAYYDMSTIAVVKSVEIFWNKFTWRCNIEWNDTKQNDTCQNSISERGGFPHDWVTLMSLFILIRTPDTPSNSLTSVQPH